MGKIKIRRDPAREAALLAKKKKNAQVGQSSRALKLSLAPPKHEVDYRVLDDDDAPLTIVAPGDPEITADQTTSGSSPPLKQRRLIGGTGELRLTSFIQEVRTALDPNVPLPRPDSLVSKALLIFRQASRVLFEFYQIMETIVEEHSSMQEVVKGLEDQNTKLEEEKGALELRLVEAESRLSLAIKTLEGKKMEESFLASFKAVQSQLDIIRRFYDVSVEDYKRKHEAVARRIESLTADLEATRRGHKVDLDCIIHVPEFKPYWEAIQQSIVESLVKDIKEKYPDLDLSFLDNVDEEPKGKGTADGVTISAFGAGQGLGCTFMYIYIVRYSKCSLTNSCYRMMISAITLLVLKMVRKLLKITFFPLLGKSFLTSVLGCLKSSLGFP